MKCYLAHKTADRLRAERTEFWDLPTDANDSRQMFVKAKYRSAILQSKYEITQLQYSEEDGRELIEGEEWTQELEVARQIVMYLEMTMRSGVTGQENQGFGFLMRKIQETPPPPQRGGPQPYSHGRPVCICCPSPTPTQSHSYSLKLDHSNIPNVPQPDPTRMLIFQGSAVGTSWVAVQLLLKCHANPIPILQHCHSNPAPMPHQCHFNAIPMPLKPYSNPTPIPLQSHCNATPIRLQFRSNPAPIPFQSYSKPIALLLQSHSCANPSTIPLQSHSNSTLVPPLQSHSHPRATPILLQSTLTPPRQHIQLQSCQAYSNPSPNLILVLLQSYLILP